MSTAAQGIIASHRAAAARAVDHFKKTRGWRLSLAESLELVAVVLGQPNWQTLHALAKRGDGPRIAARESSAAEPDIHSQVAQLLSKLPIEGWQMLHQPEALCPDDSRPRSLDKCRPMYSALDALVHLPGGKVPKLSIEGWQMIARPGVLYPTNYRPSDLNNFRPVYVVLDEMVDLAAARAAAERDAPRLADQPDDRLRQEARILAETLGADGEHTEHSRDVWALHASPRHPVSYWEWVAKRLRAESAARKAPTPGNSRTFNPALRQHVVPGIATTFSGKTDTAEVLRLQALAKTTEQTVADRLQAYAQERGLHEHALFDRPQWFSATQQVLVQTMDSGKRLPYWEWLARQLQHARAMFPWEQDESAAVRRVRGTGLLVAYAGISVGKPWEIVSQGGEAVVGKSSYASEQEAWEAAAAQIGAWVVNDIRKALQLQQEHGPGQMATMVTTFAEGLKEYLRGDPDVITLGEGSRSGVPPVESVEPVRVQYFDWHGKALSASELGAKLEQHYAALGLSEHPALWLSKNEWAHARKLTPLHLNGDHTYWGWVASCLKASKLPWPWEPGAEG